MNSSSCVAGNIWLLSLYQLCASRSAAVLLDRLVSNASVRVFASVLLPRDWFYLYKPPPLSRACCNAMFLGCSRLQEELSVLRIKKEEADKDSQDTGAIPKES